MRTLQVTLSNPYDKEFCSLSNAHNFLPYFRVRDCRGGVAGHRNEAVGGVRSLKIARSAYGTARMAVPFSYEFFVGKLAKARRREFAKQNREAKRKFCGESSYLFNLYFKKSLLPLFIQ